MFTRRILRLTPAHMKLLYSSNKEFIDHSLVLGHKSTVKIYACSVRDLREEVTEEDLLLVLLVPVGCSLLTLLILQGTSLMRTPPPSAVIGNSVTLYSSLGR